MKERPILFSGPMVRAVLADRKRQTRRICKPRKDPDFGCELAPNEIAGDVNQGRNYRLSPYGAPGEHLWVRESFSGSMAYERNGYALREWGNKIWYWADGEPRFGDWTKPRPSIHMPRHLSRITLEITGIRVERLQEISPADCVSEGYESPSGTRYEQEELSALDWYRTLWEQINGPGSWAINPWVWVVEFRRLSA